MVLKTLTGGWSLFFLAAVIPGVHLQEYSSSIQPTLSTEQATETLPYQPSEAVHPIVIQENSSSIQHLSSSELPIEFRIFHPVLQPSESIPPIGTYTLINLTGIPCIKAKMGVEYIITEKKTWYLSLDPSRVRTTGFCDKDNAVLCLTLPNSAASLQFVFRKEKDIFWVTKLTAHVNPMPVCNKCANRTYSGLLDNEKLFATATGYSYKCHSENVFKMSSELKIKLVPLQLQAFNLSKGGFGKEVECWADYYKRVVPIIIGAVVVCIILAAVIAFLIIRDRRTEGYDRL
ncbi:lysosome-associated membrane glycoprotein 3 [Notolabrus celidotus]|uniref:lysosome-associated membrane glycoprotein 3 n=1 Tax=Notolabrus celidotus TaxID=1203425 RepID=UPI00148F8A08|nr:lysosome-associated membrane glycoprotein 3 [Notolabrus celidotus]